MSNKIKILLADDEEDIKTTLRLFLEAKGYSVDTAYDGLDALDRVKTDKPALILLDIMMPLVDGIEVLKKIRSDPETSDIKIIMLTAASTKEMIQRAEEAGSDDYIVKPFDYSTLESKIKKVLGI